MSDFSDELQKKLATLAGSWASYIALITSLLYLMGYMSLKAHLNTFGVNTGVAFLDQSYFFAGADFLIFLLTTIPVVVLFLLLFFLLLAALIALLYPIYWIFQKILPTARWRRAVLVTSYTQKIKTGWNNPSLIALLGIVTSEVLIQFFMRQCFLFSDLLLAPRLPYHWMASFLLDEGGGLRSLYFSGLVAGSIVTSGLLLYSWSLQKELATAQLLKGESSKNVMPRLLITLLGVLVLIQYLLLAANYGTFFVSKVIPEVKDLGGQEMLQTGQRAWLIYEGPDGVTYLVEALPETNTGTNGMKRTLVTLPKKDIKRTEIIGHVPILKHLFQE